MQGRSSKLNQQRNSTLAAVGGRVIDTMGVDVNDPTFVKAQKKFYLLPSSHASRIGSSASIKSGLEKVSQEQNQHLAEIRESGRSNHSQSDANYNQDEIRKIDSSASSYIAARDAFFGVDKKKTLPNSRGIKTPSSIADETSETKKFGKSVFDIGKKTSLKPIKEEPQVFGKNKEAIHGFNDDTIC